VVALVASAILLAGAGASSARLVSRAAASRPGVIAMLRHRGHSDVWDGTGVASAGQAQADVVHATREAVVHATNINTVIPAFDMFFGYNIVGGKVDMTKLLIKPFYSRFENVPAGGCTGCMGRGNFKKLKLSGHTLTELVKGGAIYMTKRTGLVESITSPDEIGRFKVYGLDPNPDDPHPILLRSACTPANLELTSTQVFDWRALPRVPCSQKLPGNNHVSVSEPVELPSSTTTDGTVSGHATGTQWLIAFQGSSYESCAEDALAEGLRSTTYFERKVNGTFTIPFTTAPASTPGYTCAYLQVGGRVKVTSGGDLPDGRVTAAGDTPFLAGDSVSITGNTTATAGSTASETVSGNASIAEELYVFAPYSPCAASAQAEYGVDPTDSTEAVNKGAFSTTFTLTISPNAPSTGYLCAYLQVGSPSNTVPTGPTVASASEQISIEP
jgi:hypothetical protein